VNPRNCFIIVLVEPADSSLPQVLKTESTKTKKEKACIAAKVSKSSRAQIKRGSQTKAKRRKIKQSLEKSQKENQAKRE